MFFKFGIPGITPSTQASLEGVIDKSFDAISPKLLHAIDEVASEHMDRVLYKMRLDGRDFLKWGKSAKKDYIAEDYPEDYRFSTILRYGPGGARKQACIDAYKKLEANAYCPREMEPDSKVVVVANDIMKNVSSIYALTLTLQSYGKNIQSMCDAIQDVGDLSMLDALKTNYSHFAFELENTLKYLNEHYGLEADYASVLSDVSEYNLDGWTLIGKEEARDGIELLEDESENDWVVLSLNSKEPIKLK